MNNYNHNLSTLKFRINCTCIGKIPSKERHPCILRWCSITKKNQEIEYCVLGAQSANFPNEIIHRLFA